MSGWPDHAGFYEVLPSGEMQFVNPEGVGVVVKPGTQVTAITEYNGDGAYEFLLKVGGTTYSAGMTGAYDGSTVEDIAERTDQGGYTPLLNYQTITMTGRVGQGLGLLGSASTQINMDNDYESTGSLSNGTFTMSQHHCNGS